MSIDDGIKAQIDALWGRFWSGGIANPLTAIEQITYLIFLRLLELQDDRTVGDVQKSLLFDRYPGARWSVLRDAPPEEMFDLVKREAFPFLTSLSGGDGAVEAALRQAAFHIPKPSLLYEAVQTIDALPLTDQHSDLPGDIYESLLAELSLAGRNGQFRTPRQIVSQMVAIVEPQLGEMICDPAAGTGGFLVGAHRWTSAHAPEEGDRTALDGRYHHGFDFDATMVRLGLMNLLLHGMPHPMLRYGDTLAASFSASPRYDIVMANPPFTGSVDLNEIRPELQELGTSRTELLFTALCLDLLRDFGRAALIVPEGVLFGTSNAHVALRRRLIEDGLVGLVSLPGGVFRPYTDVKTGVLIVNKGARPGRVWFHEPSIDRLDYVAEAFHHREDPAGGEGSSALAEAAAESGSWWVDYAQLAEHRFALSAGTYRSRQSTGRSFESPTVVLAEIAAIDHDLRETLQRVTDIVAEL